MSIHLSATARLLRKVLTSLLPSPGWSGAPFCPYGPLDHRLPQSSTYWGVLGYNWVPHEPGAPLSRKSCASGISPGPRAKLGTQAADSVEGQKLKGGREKTSEGKNDALNIYHEVL